MRAQGDNEPLKELLSLLIALNTFKSVPARRFPEDNRSIIGIDAKASLRQSEPGNWRQIGCKLNTSDSFSSRRGSREGIGRIHRSCFVDMTGFNRCVCQYENR